SGCTISGNSTGIWNPSGTMTVINSTVSNNSSGGGIFNESGTMTLSGCTVSGNTSATGGGVFNSGTMTLSGCTVSDNSASVSGADLENVGVVSIYDSTIGTLGNKNTATGAVNFYASNTAFAQAAADVIAQVTAPLITEYQYDVYGNLIFFGQVPVP